MKHSTIAALLFSILILCSCTNINQKETNALLHKAENIMNEHPDSALYLLYKIQNPKSLKEPLFYEYSTLLVQAKNKNQKDITSDTIIRDAADYFLETGNQRKAATALFYWGRLNLYKEQYKIAISEFLKADELAQKEQDFYLLGLIHSDIGNIYDKQLNFDKSLEHYYLAKDYLSKAGHRKWEHNMLDRIGSIYLYMDPQQVDKAIALYQESLDFAISEKDTSQMITHLNNIAVAYSENKDYANAKRAVFESIILDINKELFNKQTTILSDIYIATGQIDSAIILMNSLSEHVNEMDKFELYSYYNILYTIYEEKNDFKTALDYQKKAMEVYTEIIEENNKESILEVQAKYEHERADNLYHQTVIEKQKNELLLSVIAIVTLVLAISMFALYQNNKKRRRIAEEKMDALESLLESEMEAAGEKLSKAGKSNALLKRKLIEELEITKKVAYIHSIKTDKTNLSREYEKLFHEKIDMALKWEHIYLLIDELYPNLRKRLDQKMPHLSKKEKQMCYLIKADFNLSEIAYILEYNQDSVRSTKYKLHKKAGFESAKEFKVFLDTLDTPNDDSPEREG